MSRQANRFMYQSGEPMKPVHFRMRQAVFNAIHEEADRRNWSWSLVINSILDSWYEQNRGGEVE